MLILWFCRNIITVHGAKVEQNCVLNKSFLNYVIFNFLEFKNNFEDLDINFMHKITWKLYLNVVAIIIKTIQQQKSLLLQFCLLLHTHMLTLKKEGNYTTITDNNKF